MRITPNAQVSIFDAFGLVILQHLLGQTTLDALKAFWTDSTVTKSPNGL